MLENYLSYLFEYIIWQYVYRYLSITAITGG